MRQVIKSDAESGDGVSIEREQPSTASKSMASFIKLGDIKGEFAGAYSNSLGGFRECSALFTTGGGGDSLTDAGLGNNSFHQGSNHLTTGPVTSVADALTNAAPESYTEVEWTYLTDGAPAGLIDPEYDELTSENSNWIWQDCNDVTSDQVNNDEVTGVRESISGTFAFTTGLPVEGLHDSVHCITEGCGSNAPISTGQPVEQPTMHQGAMNSFWVKDLAGNFLDAAGNMTETFEPLAGMDFAGSLNPVPENGGNGYDCTSFGADHYLKPKLNWDAICDLGTA